MTRPHSILIVDDCPEDRVAYRRMFGTTDAEISEADTATAAIALCREQMPSCILLDYNLPDLDGLEFIDELSESSDVPAIVMLTGQGSVGVAVEAMKRGVQEYLVKGEINTQSLWRAVEHATEVVRREREIEERRAEVESFAYAAAHDLKSPLRKVSSFCQLLQMDYEGKLDEQADLFIDRIMDSTRTMTQLIDDLLEYTKSGRSTKPFATVDLAAVAKQAVENLEHEIESAGAVVEIGNLPEVFGDEPALLQLLQNLTANAIKFSKETERRVMISAEAIEGAFQITVADNGIGIDPKYHKQIFEPLKRLHPKSAFEGSGIGLSTCKKVVEQHKGEIWVESEPGQGTKFHLTIPQHAPVGSSA